MYVKFPTPLINRFEKHFVLSSSVLEDWQEDILHDFEKWIFEFARTRLVRLLTLHYYIDVHV